MFAKKTGSKSLYRGSEFDLRPFFELINKMVKRNLCKFARIKFHFESLLISHVLNFTFKVKSLTLVGFYVPLFLKCGSFISISDNSISLRYAG